jgi:hypothetical protein
MGGPARPTSSRLRDPRVVRTGLPPAIPSLTSQTSQNEEDEQRRRHRHPPAVGTDGRGRAGPDLTDNVIYKGACLLIQPPAHVP